ncbi:hypothetical protein [Promicromonospora sukumoe]|uniref:hypothetical protein n=1 Tax=Promicromonospora sukumoe TaxID=88382 RepID=UPI000366AF6D|nr:hypothetical protein [Promicromonospora sukumoe]
MTAERNELVDAMAAAGVPMDDARDMTVAELLLEQHEDAVPVIASWIRRAYVAGAVDAVPGEDATHQG